jgi:hypothetical protein
MAQTIYGILGVAADEPDIPSAIEWCRQEGCLADYLAGAKGSYERALLRTWLRAPDTNDLPERLAGIPAEISVEAPNWRAFFDHVSTLGYTPDYYVTAYALAEQFEGLPTSRMASLTRDLVGGVARRIWKEIRTNSGLLGRLAPTVSLWPLGHVLHVASTNGSLIGGWVDLDALGVEERMFAANGWHTSGTDLVREIPHMPTDLDVRAYGRFGLFFRHVEKPPEESRSFCYVQTLSDDVVPQLESVVSR